MLPQPVYMNMGDLAQMAAAKARSSPAIIDEANEAMEVDNLNLYFINSYP